MTTHTPDDVPHLRLPVEELVPLVQLASMLARTLREHRRREGRLAHDYAEHAARLHDRAEQVPVRELTADEQRERWVRASEQAWGSELRLSNADLDQPVGQGTETLLERLQTLSKESGCPPTAVLAAVAAPVGAGRADGIAQQLQHISLPQSTESQVWREKLAEGEVVVGWMPIDEGTSSLMFEVKALDEEWAARAAEAMWEGLGAGEEAEQTMAGLQRAAAVGTAVYNGNAEYPTASASVPSAIPRIEISRAELADALKAQLGDFTGTAIAGCKAYPALHRVVENELNAGGSLGELIGRMDGINVNRARKPAALALHMMRNPVIDDDPLESPATAGSRRVPAKTAERIKTRWRGEDGDERISTSDALRNVENVRKRAVWLREFSADELRQAASRVGEAAQTTGGLTPDQMARTLESVFGDRATRAGAALEDFGMLQPALIQNVPDEVSVHPEVTLIRDRAGLREWAADITEGWDGQDDRVDAALRAMRDELAETPQTGPAPSETPRTVVPAPGEPGWVPRSRSEVRGVDDVVRFVDQLDVDSPWDQVAARGLYGQYGDAVDERLRARFTKLNFVDPYEMKKAADADGQAAEFESEATVEPTVVAQEADLTLSDEALGDADTARQRAVQATQWRQQQARRTSNRGPVQRR